MPRLDAATIRQAAQVDGLISVAGPENPRGASLQEYVWKSTPRDLFRHVQKTARPWAKILSNLLQGMTDAAVEKLLVGLEVDSGDPADILRRCGHSVRDRAAVVLGDGNTQRTVTFNGLTIIERPEGWFAMGGKFKQQELITNAIVRIDHVVHQRKRQRCYLQGRVIHRGRTLPFCIPKKDFEKDAYPTLEGLLLDKGRAALIGNPAWSKKILPIATRFQEPKVLRGTDAVGWDSQTTRFVLPKFAIGLGGKVEPVEIPIFSDDAPAQRLEPPELVTPEEADRPAQDGYAGQLFWATTACVLANILAPACNGDKSGVGLHGAGANMVGEQVAEALGCVTVTAETAKAMREALVREQEHGWPLIVRLGPLLQQRTRRLLLEGKNLAERNCIVQLDWHQARVMAIEGGWNVIVGEQPMASQEDALHLARRLVPAYLLHLCERGLGLGHWEQPLDSFVDEVLRDLARFVETRGGDPKAVLAASDVLWPDDGSHHPRAFAELLARFVEKGVLMVAPEDYSGRKSAMTEVPDVDGLLLCEMVLARLLKREQSTVPSASAVTAALGGEGALLEDRDDGWVISRAWFRKHLRRFRKESKLLRVHA